MEGELERCCNSRTGGTITGHRWNVKEKCQTLYIALSNQKRSPRFIPGCVPGLIKTEIEQARILFRKLNTEVYKRNIQIATKLTTWNLANKRIIVGRLGHLFTLQSWYRTLRWKKVLCMPWYRNVIWAMGYLNKKDRNTLIEYLIKGLFYEWRGKEQWNLLKPIQI